MLKTMRQTPRIAITCDFMTPTDSRGLPSPRYTLKEYYVDAVIAAGGEPWLLPHLEPEAAPSVLAVVSGIVISGGAADVPPSFYGETARPKMGPTREARSLFERALALAAQEGGTPLLGVCGGMQILNVALGGTLYQDLSERPGCGVHEQPHDPRQPHHEVAISKGSHLWQLVGSDRLAVNSTHHQIVREVGHGAVAVAHAPDGVIEAIEVPAHPFMLGVQWHPESMAAAVPAQAAIYRGLVDAARGVGLRAA